MSQKWDPNRIDKEAPALLKKLRALSKRLSGYFVGKQEIIDLLILCTMAQEPLLLVGVPGTAKSDIIVKFCQAIGVGEEDYFEYMLTKFTEPSEILGPIDISLLKKGSYIRRVEGKLPTASVAFLDEIFKSNSAILNTLLTIINERKFYQDGRPESVNLRMLFAATNEIPEFTELGALRDRFTLKVESESVRHHSFRSLIEQGIRNASYKALNQRPWVKGDISLEDFEKLNFHMEHMIQRATQTKKMDELFPKSVFSLFHKIIGTLERDLDVAISDRKVIKLYKLAIMHARLMHGGSVNREDLVILRYVADRMQNFKPVREKVDTFLQLE
ncbi:MAG: AAA family ATPase [Myxococcota bacterium]|nr:AAA family ATPase [Myxococcota bacterium]